MNRLYYGDCLTIMRDMPLGSVDLVYLDPPFNSNRDYSAIYQDETGQPLPDQIEAFNDLWALDEERLRAIRHMPILMRDAGIDDDVAEFWRIWLNALRNTQPRLLAYLSYMTERLLPLRGILKPTGSIYLHCDPTASHYIKCMMDGIFGHENFQNEIIWKRTSAHSGAKKYGPVHDTILFYSKSKNFTWNATYMPYDQHYVDQFFTHINKDGKRWRRTDLTGPGTREGDSGKKWRHFNPTDRGRHWQPPSYFYDKYKELSSDDLAKYPLIERLEKLDEIGLIHWPKKIDGAPQGKRLLEDALGVPAQDIWNDIKPIHNQSKERLGYATQKPVELLERIISSSSNKGDVILDPFCGCASTIEAAHKLERRWIGIDIAIHAIKRVAKVRLEDRLGLREGVDFTVEGVPHTPEGAQDLWERDKYHFQKWAIEQIDGFVTSRKTGDGGIDGRMYFSVPREKELQSMVLEVKGGKNVNVSVIRDLRGVLERDNALMAGLIIMDDLGPRKTANFKREMGDAGDLDVSGVQYPRMQMLTVPEILEGKRFLTPSVARGRVVSQPTLPLG